MLVCAVSGFGYLPLWWIVVFGKWGLVPILVIRLEPPIKICFFALVSLSFVNPPNIIHICVLSCVAFCLCYHRCCNYTLVWVSCSAFASVDDISSQFLVKSYFLHLFKFLVCFFCPSVSCFYCKD